MRLSKLTECLKDVEIIFNGDWDREIFALNTDSRKKTVNGLFICLSGENADGHAFAQEAVKNGATAIVVERQLKVDIPQILVKDMRKALGLLASVFYGEPTKKIKVIGITGTNGKTTTSYMLASILEKAGKRVGIIGTLGVRYGGKTLPATLTTPDPIELHHIFADMLLRGVEYVVMEVSAHALYYKKTVGIPFVACIFTNFTQDHLDFFKTMSAYKQAKMRLFEDNPDCIAVLNGDEETGREIGRQREEVSATRTLYFGLNSPADAFAVITEENLYGSECMLNLNDLLCRVSLSMTGRHNIYNALASALCAVELGVDTEAIFKGLSQLQGVEGRLERVGDWKGAQIYVDFAHTPDGLGKSIEALKPHCKGRLVCLFGCGGNRDKSKRSLMGEIAGKKSDFCVLTSDNPRYEDPLDIIDEIEKGYRRFSLRYVVVPDRKKAIEYALDFLREDDVLLVAGKGGENYQEIMGIKYPFNDKAIIENALKEKGKKFYS